MTITTFWVSSSTASSRGYPLNMLSRPDRHVLNDVARWPTDRCHLVWALPVASCLHKTGRWANAHILCIWLSLWRKHGAQRCGVRQHLASDGWRGVGRSTQGAVAGTDTHGLD